MEFHQRLNQLRKQAGLTQEGLAEQLGVTRQAVQKWESGASRPDLENLAALAHCFGVSLDYLVTGPEEIPEDPFDAGNRCCRGFCYEYRSWRTVFGLPLVHIRLGGRWAGVARGFFAVGNIAVGVFAVGGIAVGAVTFGGLAFGLLLALGGAALGGVSVGGLAVGLLAIGGAAVGVFALGGSACGVYAAGAAAWGSKVAVGDSAWAPLAVGRQRAEGTTAFLPGADPGLVAAAIREAAARLPRFLRELLVILSRAL